MTNRRKSNAKHCSFNHRCRSYVCRPRCDNADRSYLQSQQHQRAKPSATVSTERLGGQTKEIRKTYRHIPFTPKKWRRQAKQNQTPTMTATAPRKLLQKKDRADRGSSAAGHCGRVQRRQAQHHRHDRYGRCSCPYDRCGGCRQDCLLAVPCIEYACASGMSFLSTDTKGDVMRNYGNIAKDYGYRVSVIDLRNPTRSNGNNILYLVNKYTDLYAKHPDQIVYKAKAEKYAKIISKTIILSPAWTPPPSDRTHISTTPPRAC